MTSVSVDNNASTLTFTINLASDPSVPANNWGTHLIGFDTTSGGNGNIASAGGWSKNIQMSQGGMDFFIGNWLNNGSGNPRRDALQLEWFGLNARDVDRRRQSIQHQRSREFRQKSPCRPIVCLYSRSF